MAAVQWQNKDSGLLLAALRKRAGLTQGELADALNVQVHTVSCWENGHYLIETVRLPEIAAVIRLTPEDKMRLDLARFPALDPSWLSQQEESKRAGLLLAALRERAAMPGDILAMKLGITATAISYWENGRALLDAGKIRQIIEALELTAEDAERLLLTRLPALDPLWLSQQEEGKRAGLLLAALRERAGLTQEHLAIRLGVSDRIVLQWENGERLLHARRIKALAEELRFDEPTLQRFIFTRWPALEPGWLAGQKADKQAALLLVSFRERAGLTQGELAQAIGVNIRTVIRWETTQTLVRERYAEALVEHYQRLSRGGLTDDAWFGGVETERLRGICAMSRATLKPKKSV